MNKTIHYLSLPHPEMSVRSSSLLWCAVLAASLACACASGSRGLVATPAGASSSGADNSIVVAGVRALRAQPPACDPPSRRVCDWSDAVASLLLRLLSRAAHACPLQNALLSQLNVMSSQLFSPDVSVWRGALQVALCHLPTARSLSHRLQAPPPRPRSRRCRCFRTRS